MKKILIFGATGFIGKALTHYLIEKNYKISVVSRNKKKAEKILGKKINIFELNNQNKKLLSSVISENEIIINLAGENIGNKLWTKNQKQKILNSRVRYGELITEAIQKANQKPKLLMQASAIGFYGNYTKRNCTESNSLGKGFLAKVSKQWEESTEKVTNLGVNRIVIRTGVVLGKKAGILPQLLKPIKYFLGTNFGKGSNYISWIHIDDEIRAIEFLLRNESCSGIYNLVSPTPITSSDLNKSIGILINRPVWFSIPKFVIQFFLGKMADELILADQHVLPEKLLNEGYDFQYNNIHSALQNLLKQKNL